MNDQIFGVSVFTLKGYVKQNSTNSYSKTHNQLLYELYPKSIDKVGLSAKKYFENNKYTGLWPNAAILNKYYGALVVIENREYKIAIVFIPQHVNDFQIDNFKRIYCTKKYEDFCFSDRTIEGKRYTIKSRKNENLNYILDLLEAKKEKTR